MAGDNITRRDHGKTLDRPTTISNIFHLQPFNGYVIELEDVHFHFDSAVLLPDYGTFDTPAPGDPAAPDPATERVISLAVIRACYLEADKNQKMLIAGHTDTAGTPDYNFPLSRLRAKSFYHVLMGERDEWVQLVLGKNKVEDYQQILKWIANVWDWDCDPGNVDNVNGPLTQAAVKKFQALYNDEFDASIGVDGAVGKETWGAFFDVYIAVIANIMNCEESDLQTFRDKMQWVDDAKRTVGCGEEFPVDQPGKDQNPDAANRRVEILFYDPGQEPLLNCHPNETTCTSILCEIYNPKMYHHVHLPVDPVKSLIAFRVKVELGDIDSIFTDLSSNDSTDPGVRERMQAVGFLYLPLNDAAIAQTATDAYAHFKTVTSQATDAAAAAQLQSMVKTVIVDGTALPAPGAFTMLRMPGTYCFDDLGTFSRPDLWGAQSLHFQKEQAVLLANNNLGVIPIVATVEARRRVKWKPSGPGIKVHFQLIKPDDIPAGSPVAAPALRSTPTTNSVNVDSTVTPPKTYTFNMTGSPDKYVKDQKALNPPGANDPQVDNVHQSMGGKRGNPTAGADRMKNVLETGATRAGFQTKFSLNTSSASSHSDAVVANTNADGKAGCVLMPSWTGGDRYKLRVFLDPIRGQVWDGTEKDAVKAETGTMVVWRILRFSKYIQWNYPLGVNQPPAEVQACGGALDNFNMALAGTIMSEYKKSWFDIVVEPNASVQQPLSQADWGNAWSAARTALAASPPALSQPYDLNALLPVSDPATGLNNPSAGILRIATQPQYDAARNAAAFRPAPAQNVFLGDMISISMTLQAEFMRFFTKNAISGLTVVQAPHQSSLSIALAPTANTLPSAIVGMLYASGFAQAVRGAYVLFGTNVYHSPGFPYDGEANTRHETGHVLFGEHQYTSPAQVNSPAAKPEVNGFHPDEHDYHDLCIMGYMRCSTGFCGRCVLNHAGWNTHALTANNPGP